MSKKELLLKQAHIEVIPKGWELLNLKNILKDDPQNGYSPNCPEEPNGKWILGLGNLTESGFDPRDAKPAPLDDPKVDQFKLRPGDFIISRSNTPEKVGRTALFKGEIENCSYPDLMMRFRVNEEVSDIGFIEKVLSSTKTQQYYKSHSAGSSNTMVKINKAVVKKTPILLPPLPEQKAIADLLSTWDEAIEKTERLIQVKEKRFHVLLRQLIGEPSADDADSRRWKNLKLGEVCKVTKGKQLNVEHMKEDGPYYALNGGIQPSGRTTDWNTEAESITISEGGNSCGYVNFNRERFWSGGHCYSLLNLKTSISNYFLFFFLKMNQPKLMNLRVGSGLPNIQKKDVDNFKIVFPALKEQKQIAEALSTAQHEIDLLKQLVEKYKTQKRGLMQKMLTGVWRVKGEIVKRYEEV